MGRRLTNPPATFYSRIETASILTLELVMTIGIICTQKRQNDEIEFLGYIINPEVVKIDLRRVVSWCHYGVQVFTILVHIDLCKFCRRFVYAFLRTAKPIVTSNIGKMTKARTYRQITQLSVTWRAFSCSCVIGGGIIGTSLCNNNWKEVHQELIPILRHYDPNSSMRLETYSSRAVLAGVHLQMFEESGCICILWSASNLWLLSAVLLLTPCDTY